MFVSDLDKLYSCKARRGGEYEASEIVKAHVGPARGGKVVERQYK